MDLALANTPITSGGRRTYITEGMVKKYGVTMGCPRCETGVGSHSATCRARMISAMVHEDTLKTSGDKRRAEGGEQEGKQGEQASKRPVLDKAAASSASMQGQAGSSGGEISYSDGLQVAAPTTPRAQKRVNDDAEAGMVDDEPQAGEQKKHKIMALQVFTAEGDHGIDLEDDDEVPGAEEVALERKKQFEALKPEMLAVGELLKAPSVEDLIPTRAVYGAKSGLELKPQAVANGRRKQLAALEEQETILLLPNNFPGRVRSASGASGWTTWPT